MELLVHALSAVRSWLCVSRLVETLNQARVHHATYFPHPLTHYYCFLQALHDPLARNKTFEVCAEYTASRGLEMYELVAHLPDKSNNYLSPALATLEKNT